MTIILGIDPGSRITGYGIIRDDKRGLQYIDSGCIRTQEESLTQRLLKIYDGICQLMDEYSPDEVAIERVFVHHNPDSALKLGHARGAAMVAVASHRIHVHEYSAREVKQTIAGYGAAQKEQVKHMVMHMLGLQSTPQSDASDALAIAICHSHMRKGLALIVKKRQATRRRRI